jgi:cytidylate kinase
VHTCRTGNGVDLKNLPSLLENIKVGFTPNRAGNGWLTTLNNEVVESEIRTLEVSNMVSPVSAIAIVRKRMTQQQQEMGKQRGIVMDGRDIGTVVFPNAELKIFMTADPLIRAKLDEVLQNIEQRDNIDRNREVAPLRQAPDAIVLDNSTMSIEQQMEWFAKVYNDIINR